MKTILEIKQEIKAAELAYEHGDITRRVYKARIEVLTLLVLYLEFKPSETVIKKQISEIKQRLASINKGYKNWIKVNGHYKKPKIKFAAEMGFKQMKLQKSALECLL